MVGDERQPLPNPPVHEREPAPVQAAPNAPRPANPSPPANGTPPATGTRPTPPPSNGQPNDSNFGSIGDAISGLVGAVGSAGGSFQSGGDAGFADAGSGGSGFAEPQPAVAAEPADGKKLDIELTDVRLVDGGNLEQKTGPRFRLTYRNNGTVDVPKFNVTVAVDSSMKLTEMAEMVTVEAVGLKPGKTQTVDVRLPVEVLKMATDESGKPAPFALLVAIADSDESLEETDEENNVLVFARDEIKSVTK